MLAISKRMSTRPAARRRRADLCLEPLEERLAPVITPVTPMPSPAFDYSTPDRFGLDRNGDGRIDLPNDLTYARANSFQVNLDAGLTAGASPQATYQWTVNGPALTQPVALTGPVASMFLTRGT